MNFLKWDTRFNFTSFEKIAFALGLLTLGSGDLAVISKES